FHVGGVMQTRSLAKEAQLQPGMHVLDIGSGLGGPARTLAAEFGCRVTGLDLTEEFCHAAALLTRRVGLSDQDTLKHGSALDVPFEDNTFDAVWTQFAAMIIGDKEQLYSECRRVLRPGGLLALHEVMQGETTDLHYPVFWADDESLNFLRSPQEIRQLLVDKGFAERTWNDLTQQSFEWFQAMTATRQKEQGTPPLGFNVFVGDGVPQKAANVVRNLEEKRITVIQAVLQLDKP